MAPLKGVARRPDITATRCKVCTHPGLDEINAMLLNATPYTAIIRRMTKAHPGAPELSSPNLSTHKKNHLLARPITVQTEAGETQMYASGAFLTRQLSVAKEDLPVDNLTLPEALRTIIVAGVRNILLNPELVTPAVLIQAVEVARKAGLFTGQTEEFEEAWALLNKERPKRKRTRKVTLEETVEEGQPEELTDDLWATGEEWPAGAVLPVERTT